MKKNNILTIWKNNYKLNSKTVNQVLEFVLKLDKDELFLLEEVDDNCISTIEDIYNKLSTWYPLSYITKSVNFAGYDFYVDENVLIPRDDTEVIVRQVKNYLDNKIDKFTLIDIWTGSWIIGITVYLNNKSRIDNIILIDMSKMAINVVKKNLLKYSLDNIKTLNSDFRQFDFRQFEWKNLLLTANLPYIKDSDFINMDFSVYSFEPKSALYGWKNTWFELYEGLINLLNKQKQYFKSLILFIEIGFDQYEISNNFLTNLWLKFEYFKDTNNIYRVIKIKW